MGNLIDSSITLKAYFNSSMNAYHLNVCTHLLGYVSHVLDSNVGKTFPFFKNTEALNDTQTIRQAG